MIKIISLIMLLTLSPKPSSSITNCLSLSGGGFRAMLSPLCLSRVVPMTKFNKIAGISGGTWGAALMKSGGLQNLAMKIMNPGSIGFEYSTARNILTSIRNWLATKISDYIMDRGISGYTPISKLSSEKFRTVWGDNIEKMFNDISKPKDFDYSEIYTYYASNNMNKDCVNHKVWQNVNGYTTCVKGPCDTTRKAESYWEAMITSSSAPTTTAVPSLLRSFKNLIGNEGYFDLGYCENNPWMYLKGCDKIINLDFGEDFSVRRPNINVKNFVVLKHREYEPIGNIIFEEMNIWGTMFKFDTTEVLNLNMFNDDHGRGLMYRKTCYPSTTINTIAEKNSITFPDQIFDTKLVKCFVDSISKFWELKKNMINDFLNTGNYLGEFKDYSVIMR